MAEKRYKNVSGYPQVYDEVGHALAAWEYITCEPNPRIQNLVDNWYFVEVRTQKPAPPVIKPKPKTTSDDVAEQE